MSSQTVLQAGSITIGHAAVFASDGAIKDGGPIPASTRVLASLRNANFNSTADQKIILPSSINALQLTGILITNASRSMTTAAGGFYPQASKAGAAIVANTQVYSALTGSTVLLNATLTAFGSGTRFAIANLPDWAIYFALTVAQGVAATGDVYALGLDLT